MKEHDNDCIWGIDIKIVAIHGLFYWLSGLNEGNVIICHYLVFFFLTTLNHPYNKSFYKKEERTTGTQGGQS
jgi:hypothetical protein